MRGILAFTAGAILLAGCGTQASSVPWPPAVTVTPTGPKAVACRDAIRRDFETGHAGGTWPDSTYKPVCAGFDYGQINLLMDEALDLLITTSPAAASTTRYER